MSQYPLVLSHSQIRRITERKARTLIHTRQLGLGTVDVHDSAISTRNLRAQKQGRPEREDPLVFTLQVDDRREALLVELDLITVRAAGWRTTEEFFLEWLERKKRIDVELVIHVHEVHITETPRFLHRRVHRGYTSDPSWAARNEPEALGTEDLERLGRLAAKQREVDVEFVAKQRRSVGLKAKQAAMRGDLEAFKLLTAELALIAAGTACAS